MTIVYVDTLFLLNFAANYMLLILTARIGGAEIRWGRILLSALSGGAYAVLCIAGPTWTGSPIGKVGMGIAMCVLAFGGGRELGRTVLFFFGSAAALGGAVWAVELLGDTKMTAANGVLYPWIDVRLLLFLLAVCFCVLNAAGSRLCNHSKREFLPLELTARGRTVRLNALIDTGNTLTDPLTNRPVLVVEGAACRALLPMELPLDRPVEALEKLNGAGVHGFRLITYCTVGTRNGLLLAMQVKCAIGRKGRQKAVLAALSPTKVSDGGGYQALIGGKEWI